MVLVGQTETQKTGSHLEPNKLHRNFFDEPPRFPAVANFFSDDSEEQIFKCAVAMVAANWVLALEDCVDDDNTQSLAVRINSNFWSTGGLLKKVKNVVKVDGLVVIQLVEDQDDSCFFPANLSRDVGDKATVYFWNGDITLPLAKKSKFESIRSNNFKLRKFDNRVLFEDDRCEGHNGAPIFDEKKKLVGVQLGTCSIKALYTNFDWYKIIEVLT